MQSGRRFCFFISAGGTGNSVWFVCKYLNGNMLRVIRGRCEHASLLLACADAAGNDIKIQVEGSVRSLAVASNTDLQSESGRPRPALKTYQFLENTRGKDDFRGFLMDWKTFPAHHSMD